ncbi:MAG: SUMF1/EgtB/PvdO family nonheme iron enzyme [Treponema sp.]|nr:SUMF1/EgtB/PvdO family nonheme iron enzyme [Treponema sp.]
MKKKHETQRTGTYVLFGIAVLLAAAMFTLTGCPDGTSGDPAPTVSGVTVTAARSVAKGGTLQFSASVAGENSPAQTVTWSITTTGIASGTSINEEGLLIVAAEESSTSIEVKATSTEDESKSGMKKVWITGTSMNIEMVEIAGGTFQMGQDGVATPVHSVTVSSFNMGKYEVTQAQYQAVMETNPSNFTGDNLPVERVSWYDAIVFCNKLSIQEELTPAYTISGETDPGKWGTVPTSSSNTWDVVTVDWSASGYRLPTEAEWEYACRAGTTTGDTITSDTGWYSSNSESTTHAVGGKPANAWGLYDMHGNVWEWCWDWYGDYDSVAQTNPHGAYVRSYRVQRGGSWYVGPEYLNSAFRGSFQPGYRDVSFGFRLVRKGQ